METKSFFERSLINWLLVICLILGFICIAAIYLPMKLQGGEHHFFKNTKPMTHRLLALLPQENEVKSPSPPPMYKKNGVYFRFVPEPMPPSPYHAAIPADDEYNEELIEKDDEDLYAQAAPYKPPTIESASTVTTGKTHQTSSLALYSSAYTPSKHKSLFKVPKGLGPDVKFWKDIFTKYDSHQVVLHDTKYLDIVYGTLDFRYLDANPLITNGERQKRKEARIKAEKDRIISLLTSIEKNPTSNLTDEEYKIKKMFRNVKEAKKYKEAKKRGVRAQTGLKDKFAIGLAYSGRYLGEIEKIFKEEGLPQDLTRLIFVESMFNPGAHSSAGAKGIWQFMKRTGKYYGLRINSIMDERVDPIRSTYAAAKLLKHNYQELGTWPLAINAYNSGRGRLKQAVNRLGTRDITTIVRKFDHPHYGFASRNFFAEFLAVVDIVKNYQDYFKHVNFDEPLSYDVVWLNEPINIPEVARLSGVSVGKVAELNPAYRAAIFSGELPFPARTELRIPKDKGKRFTAAAESTPSPFPFWHTVARGETIYDIAALYNVSVSDIKRANKKLGRRLRPGRKIRISR